ncbi:MAG: sulfatase family protein [Nocardioidaceae bacterium]
MARKKSLCWLFAALAITVLASACTVSSSRLQSESSPSSASPLPTTKVTPTAKPNIIFVLTDDLSWNLVRFMPHVLQMQKTGATFSNYFVTDSLCCPSRASIFTGEFPHDTGVYRNSGTDGGFSAFQAHQNETHTFATSLSAQHYQTAMMGKYLNKYDPTVPVDGQLPYVSPGWSTWDVADRHGYREFGYTLAQNHQDFAYSDQANAYLTDVLSTKAQAFVNQSAQTHQPFMLEVASFAPHAPYVPAPRDATKFPGLTAPRTPAFAHRVKNAPNWLASIPPLKSKDFKKINRDFQKRAQSVLAVDDMIGRLQAEVQALGLSQNTYFVFSSDNGYHMGEYNLRPGKQTAFDTDIRVPLIVTGPGVPAGKTIGAMTQNIDLAPTFDQLGGATPPPSVDGNSLVALWRGQPQPDWRNAVLVEHHGPTKDTADPDYTGPLSGNPPGYEAIRTPTSLYVEYSTGEREYYNTVADPYELDNIAASLSPTLLAKYHKALVKMEHCHGQASCWAAQHFS